ncbi:hypothetical protein JVU11DRAFT_10819 [Chiua virens]|nr:hypothetical protein JVU11DRAFT_10819 [Chiua virens]
MPQEPWKKWSRSSKLYGLIEHVLRYRSDDLYPEEITLELLVGLETEFITDDDLEKLNALLNQHSDRIEYIIGSIHHVNDIPIDFDHTLFESALHSFTITDVVGETNTTGKGHTDKFISTYFDAHYRLLKRFRPEIIRYLDLCHFYNPELWFPEFPNAWNN